MKPKPIFKQVASNSLCPLPFAILFDQTMRDLGPVRIKYFLDAFIRTYDKIQAGETEKWEFEVFEIGAFNEVLHSKMYIETLIKDGLKIGLIEKINKHSRDGWTATFNLNWIFPDHLVRGNYLFEQNKKKLQ